MAPRKKKWITTIGCGVAISLIVFLFGYTAGGVTKAYQTEKDVCQLKSQIQTRNENRDARWVAQGQINENQEKINTIMLWWLEKIGKEVGAEPPPKELMK